jgi:DNA (cytosine-5)-methyltransferase 1
MWVGRANKLLRKRNGFDKITTMKNTNMLTNKSLTFADFYAGIGGFRLGLEKIGWKCVFTNEIDEYSVKTYNLNFGERLTPLPIEDLKLSNIPDFDVFCGGFPCQPFSIAGKQKGFSDHRGMAIREITRICKQKKPKVILLENVKNIIRLEKGEVLKQIISEFEKIGYDCNHTVLDSKHFGIPQSRPRFVFVATRKDLGVPNFNFSFSHQKEVSVESIIERGDNSIPVSDRWNQYIDYYSGRIAAPDLNFTLPKTRVKIERADANIDLDNCIYQIRSSGIRAISVKRPFPTFAVSVSGGGAMIPVYSKERRHLSVLEIKRLMGFPDNYSFPVSRTHSIKQLSNAVCPPVIENIGNKIISEIFR